MKEQRNSVQRDRISVVEHIDDRHKRLQPPTAQPAFGNQSQSGLIAGKIVNLKWKVPSNGIAGLL